MVAPDGTVDGLGEVARPNSSAKATIFVGARLYIELLQRRVSRLQRKVEELEQFRCAVAGEENLQRWRNDFDSRQVEEVPLSPPDYDDDEEEAPVKKRKTARAFAAFALLFSFYPSSSGTNTSGQVISRLPLITAEHASKLMSRALPSSAVPLPVTLVTWTWRLIVTVVVSLLLSPLLNSALVSEVFETIMGRNAAVEPKTLARAAATAGKGEPFRICQD